MLPRQGTRQPRMLRAPPLTRSPISASKIVLSPSKLIAYTMSASGCVP